jgi:hypothetical protein
VELLVAAKGNENTMAPVPLCVIAVGSAPNVKVLELPLLATGVIVTPAGTLVRTTSRLAPLVAAATPAPPSWAKLLNAPGIFSVTEKLNDMAAVPGMAQAAAPFGDGVKVEALVLKDGVIELTTVTCDWVIEKEPPPEINTVAWLFGLSPVTFKRTWLTDTPSPALGNVSAWPKPTKSVFPTRCAVTDAGQAPETPLSTQVIALLLPSSLPDTEIGAE